MLQYLSPKRYLSLTDVAILLLIGAVIYGVVGFGQEWRSHFHPGTTIHLSAAWLPLYLLYSALRGLAAYSVSLLFTLVVGYVAARSSRAEKVLVPVLDIFQCIPVLAFLPGLVLGLVASFPNSNIGLELAAILMIFTGQVWNMTFSFYSSLKSIPEELMEASAVMKLGAMTRFWRVELPYSAMGLAWNSLMSMASGWFFLSVCEAFTLGDREYRLPGIGSYMATAIREGDVRAMWLGVLAMGVLILLMDSLIWRPVLAWVHRFRLEESSVDAPARNRNLRPSGHSLSERLTSASGHYISERLTSAPGHYISERLTGLPGHFSEPFLKLVIGDSQLLHWIKFSYRWVGRKIRRLIARIPVLKPRAVQRVEDAGAVRRVRKGPRDAWFLFLGVALSAMVLYGIWNLALILAQLPLESWLILLRNTMWTLARVALCLVLSSLWAVPVGIWIGSSTRRMRVAQPIVQILAAFPAPMLYPLALALFFRIGMGFDWGSMFLMMLGVQWYVLFNVLAGSMRIPRELHYASSLMGMPASRRWSSLYLPSVFPGLVTGWIAAAGGAWNASIVAEAVFYHGSTLVTGGLGATISQAAAGGDSAMLAASLVILVIFVVVLNRALWARVFRLSQTRFRMD